MHKSTVSAVEEPAGTICIHGTLGVGKTAIAKHIHNKALEEENNGLFDYVIWVTVEFGAGLRQVQEKIAERLGIDLSNNPSSSTGDSVVERPRNDTEEERARRLENCLSKRKKFLLVLDSMWQPHSLKEIGIPEPINGRRLIITSRISTICRKIVGKKAFEIKPADSLENSELFMSKMRRHLPQGLEDAIETAVAECDGIPLTINKIVETLDNIQNDVVDGPETSLESTTWMKELAEATINQLSKDPKIFDRFRPSYENLKEETRRCFLCCALFPMNHPIATKELIEYWMWEELLLDNTGTLEQEREEGKKILQELKEAHLLESVDGDDRVKMLNLVRSMAIATMVKEGKHVCIKSGVCLTSLPPIGHDWNFKVERASFMCNHLKGIGHNKNLHCSHLSTLLLQNNPFLREVDAKFFNIVPNLRVLDMSRTSIFYLPSSLSKLINLRALLLRDCANLQRLPTLSNLEQLIVLDLSGTPMKHPPKGIDKMKRLRRLNLSQTKLATFPDKVVGQLRELEELLMITECDCIWGSSEDKKHDGVLQLPRIKDLVKLKKLAVLQVHFRNTETFDKYLGMVNVYSKVQPKFSFRVGQVQSVASTVEGNNLTASGISIDIGTPAAYRTSEPELNVISLCKLTSLNVLNVSNSVV